ncbi:MAG TPA: 3-oxoacyl-[acyl-carrier-protein] synthase III C-terminal domain-containing protein [Alphaproteobacteria bacterium]|nr:3-oxoacyl-[acyl-carrier-protein] synthase III C-terminal domain-containing protein [Alphaproteobacteria bacterium]
MTKDSRLLALATAVPPHELRQAEVMERSRLLFQTSPNQIERLLPVYENAGIGRRFSCVPIEWYLAQHGWGERTDLFIAGSVALLTDATQRCLEQAGLGIEEIDAVVSVSTTGIATPSLDARLMELLPFRRDLQRLPVFGLGCAGGVTGLSRAAALARATPGSKVLLLVVELCGLTFRAQDLSKSNIIATALFGDGAAALLISTEGTGPRISDWGEYTWPRSLDVMGWDVKEDGLGVLFSRDIPTLVRQELREATDRFLARRNLDRLDLAGYVCHPGGAKVLDALEDAFELPRGALIHARATLRDYGNMSAVTVLFVLKRLLASEPRAGRYLMSALGPGFTASFAMLETL